MSKICQILSSPAFKISVLLIFYVLCAVPDLEYTSDSNLYLIIAENTALYGKIVDQNGTTIPYWPPLFPIIISLGYPLTKIWVLVLHAICIVISCRIWINIFKDIFPENGSNLSSWFYILSTPLLMIHVFIWSEALFFLLFTICVKSTIAYYRQGAVKFLYLISFSGFLMLLQRNPGLFFLPGMLIVLWILLTKEKGGLKKYLILFGIILSGSLIWNINVLFLEGNQNVFKELFEGVNVVQNLIDITNEVGRSFIYGGWQVLATSVGIVIIMWALYYLIKLNYDKSSILIILFLSYLIFWVFIGIPEDNISRFLAPVTPIIIVLFVSFMQFINNRIAMFRRNKIPISIIFIGALCYSVLRLFNNMTYWIE